MSSRPIGRTSSTSRPAGSSTVGSSASRPTAGGAAPRSSVGSSASRPTAGGAAPRSSVGSSASRPTAGGAAPRSSVSGTASRPTAGGAVARPAAGGTVARPTAGGTVARPTAGGAVARPTAGGAVARPTAGGVAPRTNGTGAVPPPNSVGAPQSGSFYGGMGPRTGSMGGSAYGGMNGPQSGSLYGGMGGPQSSSLYGGMGPRTGSMRGSAYGGNPYGASGMGVGGPMGSGYGAFGSMRGMSNQGSMYGMGAPTGGSMYGMGAPMGSMYGMGGPMGGSMYGMGGPMGSMYGMGAPMGSMYGMGGPMGGSMYGMGGPMGGSMYGMGAPMGSMYGMGGPMGSMYGMGGPMGGSMYGMGGATYSSMVNAAMRRDSFLARNNLVQAKVAPLESKSNKSNGTVGDKTTKTDGDKTTKTDADKSTKTDGDKSTKTGTSTTAGTASSTTPTASSASREVKSGKEEEKVTPKVITSSSLQGDKKPLNGKSSTTEETKKSTDAGDAKDKKTESSSKDKVKPPTDTKIHTLVVVTKEGSSSSSAALKVKDATTLTSEKDDYTFDEVMVHTDVSKYAEAVMLEDLRRHWLAGHNSTLLFGASKGQKDQSLGLAEAFLLNALNRVEKEGIKFDVNISMAGFKSSDEARDLLKSGASYEKVKLGSSPVFGPALADITTKTVTKPSDCVSTFKEGIKRLESSKLAIAFFVLKQVKKATSGEETVYLSSLGFVFAGEELSHFTSLKEKSSSEPCTLLRYAVGGASVAVCMIAVSGDGKEKESVKKALETAKAMGQVKNSPPRSGNVKHFVDFTKQELPKQKENAEKNKDDKAKYDAMQKITARMEKMLKDAETLMAKPMDTKPTVYG
ncbi:uncharacterized protein TM35_000232260 [Trypanosoma theileri]|uniref:Uncharacterized protein n=1 Tax=Trypanosoma theileri TaxID=67003 RepID=A0A1X0NRB5_9TRYP|nr:uncharacterized protein TM35_000232260 [Trypanosoma theileri]ORC87255.1 hypothetical protein TM35_000232260 [Trypanosoma theileri]